MSEEPQQAVQVSLTTPNGRLHIVPPSAEYDKEVALLRMHPESRKYLPFFPEHVTVEEIRDRRRARAKVETIIDFYVLLISEDSPPKFIGLSGIFNVDKTNRSCSTGIMIHPDYFRGGFGTEVLYTVMKWAFEDESLRMHRIAYETGANNVMMRGWLENVVGIQQEFRWREAWAGGAANPGKWIDVAGYSILEQEWFGEVKERLERRIHRSPKN